MKWLKVLIIALICIMQYKLWLAPTGGVPDVLRLKQILAEEDSKNQELQKRNRALEAEVQNLKAGQLALEERARVDLGMVKEGEEYYHVVN